MRATDGLQTTITHRPVNVIDQKFALELSLGMTLPIPPQDEHLPDQIETIVHQTGLEAQRRLFQALMERAEDPMRRWLRIRFASEDDDEGLDEIAQQRGKPFKIAAGFIRRVPWPPGATS